MEKQLTKLTNIFNKSTAKETFNEYEIIVRFTELVRAHVRRAPDMVLLAKRFGVD